MSLISIFDGSIALVPDVRLFPLSPRWCTLTLGSAIRAAADPSGGLCSIRLTSLRINTCEIFHLCYSAAITSRSTAIFCGKRTSRICLMPHFMYSVIASRNRGQGKKKDNCLKPYKHITCRNEKNKRYEIRSPHWLQKAALKILSYPHFAQVRGCGFASTGDPHWTQN